MHLQICKSVIVWISYAWAAHAWRVQTKLWPHNSRQYQSQTIVFPSEGPPLHGQHDSNAAGAKASKGGLVSCPPLHGQHDRNAAYAASKGGLVSLRGIVKDIIFRRGIYTVLRVKVPKGINGRKTTMTLQAANGVLGAAQVGEELEVRGRMVQHKTYGQQFAVDFLDRVIPPAETDQSAITLLRVIKGVGPKMAEKLVTKFGNKSLEMLKRGDPRLLQVQGIGPKTLAKFHKQASEHFAKTGGHEALAFVLSLGLTLDQSHKLYKEFQAETKTKLEQNPYLIYTMMPQLGFDRVDHIARTKLNASVDSSSRAAAAIEVSLRAIERNGHCHADPLEIITGSQHLLVCAELTSKSALRVAKQELDRMRKTGLVHSERLPSGAQASASHENENIPQVFYRPQIWHKEVAVANAVRQRCGETPLLQSMLSSLHKTAGMENVPSLAASVDFESIKAALMEHTAAGMHINKKLSPKQRDAVEWCSTMGVDVAANGLQGKLGQLLVLTGVPGTGKTFTVREIAQNWLEQGKKVMLASPTARAAKVLQKTVGVPASTMHRLLEYHPLHGFKRNRNNPLEADAVVIDEASMLDIHIAALFLEALPRSCIILFVGDANQLPSVGPGAVLRDLLGSPRVQRVELTDIFRTDPLGDIARNSALINMGSFPAFCQRVTPQQLLQKHEQRPVGCIFVPSSDASEAQDTISTCVLPWLRSVGYDLGKDLKVLAPMKRGPAGTIQLNQLLGPQINPKASRSGNQVLDLEAEEHVSVGDHMIQLVNDYDAGVFNGDMGIVTDVSPEGRGYRFTVKFDTGTLTVVTYKSSMLGQRVALAYALTVHKAQGSQYEVVCMPVVREHAFMLDRSLLYTGTSRAKRLLVLVGSEDAISRAVKNKKANARRTLLQQRISNDDFVEKVTPRLWLEPERASSIDARFVAA